MSRSRRRAEASPEVILPITPMLDMSFQLLFFFISIYQPPSVVEVELTMTLALPEKPSAPPDDKDNPAPALDPAKAKDPMLPKKLPNNLVLVVNTHLEANNQTSIDSFTVKHLQAETRKANGLEEDAKKMPDIVVPNLDKLRDLLKNAHLKDDTIPEQLSIEAPAKEKWGTAVQILDMCREAGWKNVVFAEPK